MLRNLTPQFLFDADEGAGSGSDSGTDESGGSEGTPNGSQGGAEGATGAEGTGAEGRPAPSQHDLDKAYAKLRAAERESEALRKEKEERELEEKSDLEKAEIKIKELEAKREQAEITLRKANVVAALTDPKFEIAPDAVALVAEAIDVEFDEDGKPTNLKESVELFLGDHPSLKARPGGGNGSSPAAIAAGRGGGGEKLDAAAVRRLAKEDTVRFNELWDKGEIPSSALGS